MIIELLALFSICISGYLLAVASSARGVVLPIASVLYGISLMIVVGLFFVIINIPTNPAFILIFCFIIASVLFRVRQRKANIDLKFTHITSILIAVTLFVVFFYVFNLFNWHVDSFFNLLSSGLLAQGFYEYASMSLMEKRMLAVPILHSPAFFSGELYLRAITPLISLSTIAVLVWFYVHGTLDVANRNLVRYVGIIGLLVLITNNRYIFQTFYINGHLLFALFLIVIVGAGWLLTRNHTHKNAPSVESLEWMQLIPIPALVVTRPEAFIVAAFAILPSLLSNKINLRHKRFLLYVLGGTTLLWHGYLALTYYSLGAEIPLSTYGPILFSILLLISSLFIGKSWLENKRNILLWILEIALWTTLIGLAFINPQILTDSVLATIKNLLFGEGAWGLSFMLTALAVILVLIFRKFPDQIFLRLSMTTFVPIGFILAFLRDAAYRVGHGDSLNRMLLQILPLMILFIMVALASGEKNYLPNNDSFKFKKHRSE